jgi:hypothetical protein
MIGYLNLLKGRPFLHLGARHMEPASKVIPPVQTGHRTVTKIEKRIKSWSLIPDVDF